MTVFEYVYILKSILSSYGCVLEEYGKHSSKAVENISLHSEVQIYSWISFIFVSSYGNND